MRDIKVALKFTDPVLGSSPSDPEIYSNFLAKKAPDGVTVKEELEDIGVEEYEEKHTTCFYRDHQTGKPYIRHHQIKGFFKDTCGALQRMKGEKMAENSLKLKAYKKVIDGCIFVTPTKIPFIDQKMKLSINQRPLRGQTPQGETVSLASSEEMPAGNGIIFTIRTPDLYRDVVYEWLNYGKYRGLLQWRNAGYGRFIYKVISETDVDTGELLGGEGYNVEEFKKMGN